MNPLAKVLIIGIDGMDRELIRKYGKDLPNISVLQHSSPVFDYKSVFPPDTPTAWASIYTGLNPAQHGILFFVDPLDRIGVTSFKDLENSMIKGRTFWDIAGKAGKKCCILFPELGFPVWDINGVMVAKSKERYSDVPLIDVFPDHFFGDRDLSHLAAIRSVSKKNTLNIYLEAYRKLIRAEQDFSIEMYQKEEWDIFFTYSCGLDWIGHSLWNHFDEDDPSYVQSSRYHDVLKEFYVQYDLFVGEMVRRAGKDTIVILLSDHGFGRRPTQLLNINKILKEKGLLVKKTGSASRRYILLEHIKKIAISYVNNYGAGDIIMKLFVSFPQGKKILTKPQIVDWDLSVAFVSDLSGIKSYQYGGITIDKEKLPAGKYETIRTDLISFLSQVKDPATGLPVIDWICRREDYYRGEYETKYPDIIFHMFYNYGAGWELDGALISECKTHNIQPGSHRIDTPVLYMQNLNSDRVIRKNADLFDIAPTILRLLDVPTENLDLYGKSLVQ